MGVFSVFKKNDKDFPKKSHEQNIQVSFESTKESEKSIVLTEEMSAAKNEIINSETKLIWIYGKAGTGKSTFLDYLKNVEKLPNTVYLAPTGIAALIISGVTIHSFFRIKPEDFYKEKPLERELIRSLFPKLRKVERIVIDEISMVRADLLDEVDRRMRLAKHSDSPFGGIKVVFLGDAFQLPSVVIDSECKHFGKNKEYKSEFFFSSKVIRENVKMMKHFQFSKVFRQKDIDFLNLLTKYEGYKYYNSNEIKSR